MFVGTLLWLCLADGPPICPAEIIRVDRDCVVVAAGDQPQAYLAAGIQLVLVADMQPLGCYELVRQRDGQGTFRRAGCVEVEADASLRSWLVAPDAGGRLLGSWPTGAALRARVDQVGPGARCVWVGAGSNHGVGADEHWWLRFGGQPVARFDVRWVEPEVCFCAAVPLAADLPLCAGQLVELWPAPGERRHGMARTAVAFVEQRGEACVVWVAAPPHAVCPPEPHVDFYHADRYVGHGVVEARDDQFWYVRLVPVGGRAPVTSQPTSRAATTAPGTAGSQPAEGKAPVATRFASGRPRTAQVGDVAIVRTRADIDRRRFVARVFEISPEGALINAGEDDGLRRGQIESLFRAGCEVGRVEITRVQRGYSVVRFSGDTSGPPPQPGDEIRFSPPAAPAVTVAVVESVQDGRLFSALVVGAPDPPMMRPLAVLSDEHEVGTAVLLVVEGSRVCGFVLDGSVSRPLRPGDRVVCEGVRPGQGWRAAGIP